MAPSSMQSPHPIRVPDFPRHGMEGRSNRQSASNSRYELAFVVSTPPISGDITQKRSRPGTRSRLPCGDCHALRPLSSDEVHLPDRSGSSLPYDPSATLSTQVAQSVASSLEHLESDYVDSYILHGPASPMAGARRRRGLVGHDENASGSHSLLGVSNVSLRHLEQMTWVRRPGIRAESLLRQSCRDRAVRAFCSIHRKIVYRFLLLTANGQVLEHPLLSVTAARLKATRAQVVFRFAREIGILPLTGTSDAEHMKQDLASRDLAFSSEEVQAIESLAG